VQSKVEHSRAERVNEDGEREIEPTFLGREIPQPERFRALLVSLVILTNARSLSELLPKMEERRECGTLREREEMRRCSYSSLRVNLRGP